MFFLSIGFHVSTKHRQTQKRKKSYSVFDNTTTRLLVCLCLLWNMGMLQHREAVSLCLRVCLFVYVKHRHIVLYLFDMLEWAYIFFVSVKPNAVNVNNAIIMIACALHLILIHFIYLYSVIFLFAISVLKLLLISFDILDNDRSKPLFETRELTIVCSHK